MNNLSTLESKNALLSAFLAAPQGMLLTWITEYFNCNPTAEISGVHVITGREFYSGDAMSYATTLTSKGYKEQDRNGTPREGLNAYDELDTEQLLEMCLRIQQQVPQQQMKPDTSKPVLGEVGAISCINVARKGEPEQLRYFGRGKGCSGQAHPTIEQAEADVKNWYLGRPVVYEQHAVVPLPPAPIYKARPRRLRVDEEEVMPDCGFVIGLNNTWPQAWEALLAGHQVKLPDWHVLYSMILNGNTRELELVQGNDKSEWVHNDSADSVSGADLLATNWIVLPKIHPEPITV